jgi:putative endonuclease
VVEGVPMRREKVCIPLKGIVPLFGTNPSVSALSCMPFYVYILQSLKDSSFYVGQCDDLDKRMSKHFDGMSKYTASKRPLRLCYFETFVSRSDAIKREKQIKQYKSKKYIQSLISNRLIV